MTRSDEIIEQLELRVAQRRQEGKYPIGLEQQLEAEFDAIMDVVHRGEDVLSNVQNQIGLCRSQIESLTGQVSIRSRIPGFSIFHLLLSKIFGRQTTEIVTQVRQTLEIQQNVLEQLLRQFKIQQQSDARVLNQLSHVMQDRLMMIDVLAQSIIELEGKVSKDS